MLRRCTECWKTLEPHEIGDDKLCPSCGSKTEVLGPIYVNVYLVDQAYGGPEEGGWWYLCGEPVESIVADSEGHAKELAISLEAGRYNNAGRRPIHSVLSEGEYDVRIEQHFARPFPERKPHYE